MLYSDLIELRRKEPGAGSWFAGAARDAHAPVDGHGTGVSTGVGTDACSFAPDRSDADPSDAIPSDAIPAGATPVNGSAWDRLTQALSVTGNVLAGALFLGGLFFVPLALERLTTHLALL